ncbi:BQ5605_C025g10020 [Microbotryum silenes-dioicae]|uniref:BQ5605_C025g10020 protein n=1 Tax=Microbotryum silenes-dioicae TaxID=796604 RepID=A0A2X0NF57_9BASI|nr:BQ5605_C025g10020 [Microbotryum silenes-dioicae]
MTPHTETSLKALTVPKLKDLLTAASLSTVGKKDELIARLLEAKVENGSSASAEPEAAATSTTTTKVEPIALTENAVASSTEAPSTDAASVTPAAPAPAATPAVPEPTAEEKAERLRLEQEKRAARAARFGVVGNGATAAAAVDEMAKAKEERAKRFGLPQEGEKEKQDQLDKSLSALDRPLGEKRAREPKAPKPATGAPNSAAATPAKAAAPAEKEKEIDPELAAKIAQEEERKRKRAERFGAPAPVEKKAKTAA